MISNITTVDLPANKSFAHRRAVFARVTEAGEYVAGVLMVQERTKADGPVKKSSRYAVQEIPSERGRCFRLRKPLTEGSDDYYVHLPVPGGPTSHPECVCVGYEHDGTCKHAQAMTILVTAGALPVSRFCLTAG